jgi:PAS domain S-box-containing protein
MEKTKVLVVEDDRITALDVENSLESLGYTVLDVVETGEKALERAHDADVVLMDIYLNGEMDGIEAAGTIRERHDKPVIFLTVYSDVETLKRVVAIEPFGYIVKPFEMGELRSAIEIAIYKHHIESELRLNETMCKSLLMHAPAAIVLLDAGGKVFLYNEAARAILLDGDISGRPFVSLFSQADSKTVAGMIDAREGAGPHEVVVGDFGQGSRCLTLLSAPIDWGRGRGVLVVGFEVARSAQEVRESAPLPVLALEMSRTPVLAFDCQGALKLANRAALDLLGYTRKDLLELNYTDLDADFDQQDWEGFLAGAGNAVRGRDVQMRTRDGGVVPVGIEAAVHEVDGEQYAVVALLATDGP